MTLYNTRFDIHIDIRHGLDAQPLEEWRMAWHPARTVKGAIELVKAHHNQIPKEDWPAMIGFKLVIDRLLIAVPASIHLVMLEETDKVNSLIEGLMLDEIRYVVQGKKDAREVEMKDFFWVEDEDA